MKKPYTNKIRHKKGKDLAKGRVKQNDFNDRISDNRNSGNKKKRQSP